MYVILVNDDNSLYGSRKERIMQRSKLVDNLIFIVKPIYRNAYDMTNATVMLEYLLPVSKQYKTEILELSEEKYNDCFLQYKLPLDSQITSEAGKIELQLTFAFADIDADGKDIQMVRKTSSTIVNIIPIAAWADIIPDSALGGLDQRLIMLNAQIQALDNYMNVLDDNKVDNLVYNDYDETLQLTSNGIGVGDKVSIREMLDDGIPVVDLESDFNSGSNDSNKDHNHNCNHVCKDDVIEF